MGFVHRDIKPENILVDRYRVYLQTIFVVHVLMHYYQDRPREARGLRQRSCSEHGGDREQGDARGDAGLHRARGAPVSAGRTLQGEITELLIWLCLVSGN